MTESEKKAIVTKITGVNDEVLLSYFLNVAKEKILRKMYPFRDPSEDENVPEKYENLQCDIAIFLLNKRGAEGETYHSENGIIRQYENADVPNSMLKEVVPFVGVKFQ